MPSTTEAPTPPPPTAEDHHLARLAAVAVTLHLVEAGLPSPLPGIKPGLANIITLAILVRLGWRAAAWVTLLRVFAGSLIYGTLLTPTFLLSVTGACASLTILGLLRLTTGKLFGTMGYSILAAIAHLGAQLVLAYHLFLPYPGLWQLLPLFLSAALFFGTINGLAAGRLLALWRRTSPPPAPSVPTPP